MLKNPWDLRNKKSDDKVASNQNKPRSFIPDNEVNERNDFNNPRNQMHDNILNKVSALYGGRMPDLKNSTAIGLIIAGLVVFWLLTGFYVVAPEQKAIVTRFGKYERTVDSGLHYHLPVPIEHVIKETVTRVHTVRIDSNSSSGVIARQRFMQAGGSMENAPYAQGALMLTGDQNVIEMQFEVQWRINDLRDFVFNIKNPINTIVDVSQSIIREIVSQNQLAAILTNGRALIESNAQAALQNTLNKYGTGVEIVLVQMLKADPPTQVIDAFRDVQTARVDKESKINIAEAYSNDALPRARGRAQSIINEAKGYAAEVTNKAKGDASKFTELYSEYKNHKYITRKRIYLETMEELFSRLDKVIIDSNSAKTPLLPHMPVQWPNALQQNGEKAAR